MHCEIVCTLVQDIAFLNLPANFYWHKVLLTKSSGYACTGAAAIMSKMLLRMGLHTTYRRVSKVQGSKQMPDGIYS